MTEKTYKLKLEKDNNGARLTYYQDEDRNFKSPIPTSMEDKMIVENLRGLLKKLDSDELNVKIELK